MSSIGLFGGRGTEEEVHLQAVMKAQYSILDEVDVKTTKDYRRFKFLIFPSRLSYHAKPCFDAISGNPGFRSCMGRFLEYGGRILLCPPSLLRLDHWPDDGRNSLVVDWLPVGPIKLRRMSKHKVTPQVRRPDHPLCSGLTSKEQVGTYGYFENTPDAEVLISTPRGIPLLAVIPVGTGSVITSAVELPFLDPNLPSGAAAKLFRRVLEWGQEVASAAVSFGWLVPRVRDGIGGDHAATLMESAERSLLARRFTEASRNACDALDIILHAKAGGRLSDVIRKLFPEDTKEKRPEFYLCNGVRVMRNALAHGKRLDKEVTVEETECLFSTIKFIISWAVGGD